MARLAAILVFFTVILPSDSVRTALLSSTSEPESLVKCVAKGEGAAEGMSVSKGVPSRIKDCAAVTNWQGGKATNTYIKMFSEAMSVKMSIQGKCVCSTGITEVVTFKPKDDDQKKECQVKGRSRNILVACWNSYEKQRGMIAALRKMAESGDIVALKRSQALWLAKDFVVTSPGKCLDGLDCDTVTMPSAVSGADDATKKELRKLMKKVLAGDVGELTAEEQEVADGMTSGDICAILDSDEDGKIGAEELVGFYDGEKPEDIKQWVAEVNEDHGNTNDYIVFEEFEEFKSKMRPMCPAGTFWSTADSAECKKCEGNAVASSAGSTECTECKEKFANFDKTDCKTTKAKWKAEAFLAGPAAGAGGDDGAGAGDDGAGAGEDGAGAGEDGAGAGVPAGAVAAVICYRGEEKVDPKECIDDDLLKDREWYDEDADDEDAKAAAAAAAAADGGDGGEGDGGAPAAGDDDEEKAAKRVAGAATRAAIMKDAMDKFNKGCDEDE